MSKSKKQSGSSVAGASMHELQAELRVRERSITRLQSRRSKLYEQISTIDAELSQLGVLSSSGSVLRRPKNDMNLVDSIAKMLDGKTMSVTEISEQVIKAGYKTTAANFRTIVNQALIREKKVFKKISRGQYTAK